MFSGGVALEQLWLFVLAPLAGAAVAGLSYGVLLGRQVDPAPLQESQQG